MLYLFFCLLQLVWFHLLCGSAFAVCHLGSGLCIGKTKYLLTHFNSVTFAFHMFLRIPVTTGSCFCRLGLKNELVTVNSMQSQIETGIASKKLLL